MEQLNIFSYTLPQYKITKPIRLIELFAGIGSQAKALKNLGVNFEHHRVVEWDKYAVASYNAIHGTNFTTSDITKISGSDLGIVDTHLYDYILTYSFPCQDLSLAGKQKGMAKGSNTRSGLLWEVERLLEECCGFKEHRIPPSSRSKIHSMSDWVDDYNYDIDNTKLPQVLLMENVPQVMSQANISDFQKWQYKLEQLGYSNYVQLLNAKDYGIPQNRNRCFMVSILGNYYYEFPQKQELKLRLKDLLEDEVDEKYYIKDYNSITKINSDYSMLNGGKWEKLHDIGRRVYSCDYLSPTIHTMGGGNLEPNVDVTNITMCLNPKVNGKQPCVQDRVYDSKGISTAITTSFMPSIAIPEATKKGYAEAQEGDGGLENRFFKQAFDTLKANECTEGDTINAFNQKVDKSGIAPTLTTRPEGFKTAVLPVTKELKIRKLTPKECWRLMGFSDEDFEKASKVNSNSQLYKQVGNSIVVNVLMAIFKELL